MKSHLKAIIALILVPLIAYGITGISWRGALADSEALQRLGLQRLDALTVEAIMAQCNSIQTAETAAVCNTAKFAQGVRQGAIATIIFSLLVYGVIISLGILTQRRPTSLICAYRLSLYLALVTALILLPVQILLLIGAFWLFVIPISFIAVYAVYGILPLALALAVALVAGIYYILRAYFHIFWPPAARFAAYALPPTEAPLLWQEVSKLAASMETNQPNHILVGFVPGFSVSAAPIHAIGGKVKGMTLMLPLTDLSICSIDDFRAIIAHELAHFRAQDVELTRKFFPLWRSTVILLGSLQTKINLEGSPYEAQFAAVRYGLLAPLRLMLTNLLYLFWQVESRQRRLRELAADAASARIVGAAPMAASLIKLHAYAKTHENTNHAIIYGIRHEQPLTQIAAWFRSGAGYRAELIKAEELDHYPIPHPLDSHPLLGERLRSLNITVNELVNQAIKLPTHETAAASLIPNFQGLDTAITAVVNANFSLPFKKAVKAFKLEPEH